MANFTEKVIWLVNAYFIKIGVSTSTVSIVLSFLSVVFRFNLAPFTEGLRIWFLSQKAWGFGSFHKRPEDLVHFTEGLRNFNLSHEA